MQNIQFFIGIDVSKPHFDVSLLQVVDHVKGALITDRFDNTAQGIKKFGKWLQLKKVSFDEKTLIVIENTGIYHRLLWAYAKFTNFIFLNTIENTKKLFPLKLLSFPSS